MSDDQNEIFYQWDLREQNPEFSLDQQLAQVDENAWKLETGLNEQTLSGAVETLIFLHDKPITIQKIRKTIGEIVPVKIVHEAINKLQQEYEQKHHGIRLAEIAEGYQFRTKPSFSKFVEELFRVKSVVLSPLALEVLTIIAFKQPITKLEIDRMRGVDSGHLIRGLMDKRLVEISGKENHLGKSSTYRTTSDFLETFGLNTIDDLPSMDELSEIAETDAIEKIKDIKEIVQVEDKKKFFYDEVDEVDELQNKIKSISTQTNFIKHLKDENKKANKDENKQESKSAFDILEDFVFNQEEEQEQEGSIEMIEEASQDIEASSNNNESINDEVSMDEIKENINQLDLNNDDELKSFDSELSEESQNTLKEEAKSDVDLDFVNKNFHDESQNDENEPEIDDSASLETSSEEKQEDNQSTEESLEFTENEIDHLLEDVFGDPDSNLLISQDHIEKTKDLDMDHNLGDKH
jgi:segregation and condensation protein B